MKEIWIQDGYRRRRIHVRYTIIGALIGYVVLHPISLFILGEFNDLVTEGFPLGKYILHSFTSGHYLMSLYFALLGTAVGWVYGFMASKMAALLGQLRELSIIDENTGLYNRRYLFWSLENELGRGRRYHHPVSAMILDIDHFKQINDRFGHREGDAVLARLGAFIKKEIRETDIAVRYGGEEFMVIMPETDKDQGMLLAEWLRERIESGAASDGSKARNITVSCGVAEYPRDADDTESLIRSADKALYRAKNSGRNQVCAAG